MYIVENYNTLQHECGLHMNTYDSPKSMLIQDFVRISPHLQT